MSADGPTRAQARITLTVNGRQYDGWLQSDVRRSIEQLAGTFAVPVTLVPGSVPEIKRQDEIAVQIGDVTLITGYVLAAEPFYEATSCGLQVAGRDRSGDLVPCSAVHQGGQWRNTPLERIVRDIVQPFGLAVRNVATGSASEPIRDFKLEHGERCADAIARAARLRGVLVVPDTRGGLVITRAGTTKAAGAIVRGINVIRAEGLGTDEDRHSQYLVYGQANASGNFDAASKLKATSKDVEMKRHLPLIVNAEGNLTAKELQELADHTARVRRGHSFGIRYTLEGWTVDGQPWQINTRVPIYDDVFGLDGIEWLVCETNFTCSLKDGDVTVVTVRPVEAYDTIREGQKPRPQKSSGKRGRSDRAKVEKDPS